jgi:DNA-binding LacI/PurR family transcriptional regulator
MSASKGGKSPTMDDVAREAGVSRALVSIALRGANGVSDSSRAHILKVAKRMGYRPNAVAARLASKTSLTVGVFLLDLYNYVFADIYEGIRSVISNSGRHIVLAIGSADATRDVEAMESLLESRVGVVIAAGLQLPDREVQRFARATPLVSTTRAVPGIDSALCDDQAGAQLAVSHLHALGHRRIAHLASPQRDGYQGRRRGYQAAMADRGLAPLVVEVEYTQAAAAEATTRLLALAEPPSAIFANNDVAALGVMDALDAGGLVVGEDVSVVGYDNTPVAQLPAVSLTSVDQHTALLGRNAAELALRRAARPDEAIEHRTSQPELVVRRSSRPPRFGPRT